MRWLALLLPFAAFAVEVDGIAARVGSDAILRSEVVNEMRHRNTPGDAAYRDILEELIDRKLILKAAAESKMTMQEWVVDNRIREIVNKSFDSDRNKLVAMLGTQKMSYPEWRARMKDDLIVGAMRWNVVDKNVSASPAALRKEFSEHPERYASEHRVSATVIMLKPDEIAKRDEISEKLKTADITSLGGRRYENIKPEDFFRPEICEELCRMPKGTLSHWIDIDGWSFLLRKDSESVGKRLTFEEAFDQVEANVKEAEAKRLYKAWIERLRAETYIKTF